MTSNETLADLFPGRKEALVLARAGKEGRTMLLQRKEPLL